MKPPKKLRSLRSSKNRTIQARPHEPFKLRFKPLDVWVNSLRVSDSPTLYDRGPNWRQHALDRSRDLPQRDQRGSPVRSSSHLPRRRRDLCRVRHPQATRHKDQKPPHGSMLREACLVMAQYGPTAPVDVERQSCASNLTGQVSPVHPTTPHDGSSEIFFPKNAGGSQKAASGRSDRRPSITETTGKAFRDDERQKPTRLLSGRWHVGETEHPELPAPRVQPPQGRTLPERPIQIHWRWRRRKGCIYSCDWQEPWRPTPLFQRNRVSPESQTQSCVVVGLEVG